MSDPPLVEFSYLEAFWAQTDDCGFCTDYGDLVSCLWSWEATFLLPVFSMRDLAPFPHVDLSAGCVVCLARFFWLVSCHLPRRRKSRYIPIWSKAAVVVGEMLHKFSGSRL